MSKLLLLVCLLALTACSRSSAPKTSVYQATGNSTQRVVQISGILAKHKSPPTTILNAQFVEEQTGDGGLGPSDFRAFYFLEVSPQDVAQWTKLFSPLTEKAEYAAPVQPQDWWVRPEIFASLQFYKPDTLTGRTHGWIGISPQTGRIYIFTFTM